MYAKRMYSEKGRLSTVDAWANQYNIIACRLPCCGRILFIYFPSFCLTEGGEGAKRTIFRAVEKPLKRAFDHLLGWSSRTCL